MNEGHPISPMEPILNLGRDRGDNREPSNVIELPVIPIIGRHRAPPIPFNWRQLRQLSEKYFETDFVGRTQSTIRTNRYRLDLFIRWLMYNDYKVVSADVLTMYSKRVVDTGTTRTAKECWATICRFFNWMERVGYISESPHWAVKMRFTTFKSKPSRPMTHEEYKKLRACAEGHWLDWIFMLAWSTGMSLHDCCALRWLNVDMNNCIIRIKRQKSASEAMIPFSLHDELGMALSRMASLPHKPEDLICPDAGERLDPVRGTMKVNALIRYIFKRAGLHGVGMHSMRRSYISMLANSGMSHILASKISGHLNPQVMASYVHPDPNELRKHVEHAKENAGLNKHVFVEAPVHISSVNTGWKPHRRYRVRGGRIKLPDGTPVEYVFTSANAEGRRAVVTPCEMDGTPVGTLQVLADIADVKLFE